MSKVLKGNFNCDRRVRMKGSDARQMAEGMALGSSGANVEEKDWQPLFKR
jgi:hypothetical protein